MLQQAGIGIQAVRSSQNQYNYIERDFDIAELKLLIDAVMSAKFMTKGKSDQLVAKLTALAGANKARELKRNLTVDGRYKMENEQILMTIDAINDAINQRRKIKFQKIEYNVKKEQILHHGGETYTFSPYSLVWESVIRPDQVKRYQDTLDMLKDKLADSNGTESIPLSKEEAQKLAELAKKGEFRAEDFGLTSQEEMIVKEALKDGLTAAAISMILKAAPEIYKAITYLMICIFSFQAARSGAPCREENPFIR